MTKEKNTDLKQFRIYYDGVIKYDARYPLQEHWINQIVKRWWNVNNKENYRGFKMTEEIKYYTGNCIADLHTDAYNKKKCKQYIKSGSLNFCMSSVCPEKDCIFALVNKLHQRIDSLEQENKELKNKNICRETCEYFKRICNENTLLIKYRSTLEEINRALLGIHGLSIHCNKQIIKVKAIINEVLNA